MERLSDVIIQSWYAYLPWNDHLHCLQLNRRIHRLAQNPTAWFTFLKESTFPGFMKRPLPQIVRVLQQIHPRRVDLPRIRYAHDFLGFLQLNRLRTLNLAWTLIEDPHLTGIAFAPQLTYLNLTATLITGSVFEYWPSRNLTHLDLTGCTNWQPQCLPFLLKFPLQYLSLAQIARLRETDLMHLPPNLTYLSLVQTAITTLRPLQRLTQLMTLLLKQTRLSPDEFYSIAKLPLQKLNLALTPTSDTTLQALETCPLVYLNLEQTQIHGPGLQFLNRKSLHQLNLSHNANITSESLVYLSGLNLSRLILTSTPITHLHFMSKLRVKTLIASRCQYLANISTLSQCSIDHLDLSETAITTLTLPASLETLNLSACPNLQDNDFNLKIPIMVTKLLIRQMPLTDMSLVHLARWRIHHLCIDKTNITPTGWQLYTNCKLPL